MPGLPDPCVVEAVDDRDDGVVRLYVTDHGVGVPRRDLDRIFERFYRVDRARSRETGGTGLGLAIVRHVASNHGGDVQVDSTEGVGSTFTLVLPRASVAGAGRGRFAPGVAPVNGAAVEDFAIDEDGFDIVEPDPNRLDSLEVER